MKKKLFCLLGFFSLLFYSSYSWSIELILVGDCRQSSGNENYVLAEKIINDAIQYVQDTAQPPSELQGIILTGDYVLHGKDPAGWETFRTAYSAAFEYPLYPCLGNHDTQVFNPAYTCWNYYDTFHKPRWYSADIGNVHLVSLDSDLSWNPFSTELLLDIIQHNWFTKDLRSNAGKFNIVIWHEPAYSSHPAEENGHGSNLFMRQRYVPVCEAFGVDLVLCGHNHWYERTLPIKNCKAADEGITYITSGGGGATLYPAAVELQDKLKDKDGNILSAANTGEHHFCVISVSDNAITIKAIKYQTHEILDSFEIQKN
jgi:3',5'-cyclic AMP phosphodiesterase CpdA